MSRFSVEPKHHGANQFVPKKRHSEMLDISLSANFSEAKLTSFDICRVFATICTRMADEASLVEKSRIMDGTRMERALSRLATEIVESNHGAENIYLVGIRRRGVPLAERLRDKIEALEGTKPLYGIIDITLYRDDLSTVGANPIVNRTELGEDIEGKCIVLVDDVLYTGRTIRAAMDQLMDFGRPKWVQLAVLIDRGKEHRELPIQADFVGKVVPTSRRHFREAERMNLEAR
jgi:pyrimidine operon attenuation protein/uracil phosphoribosyltransferase